VIRLRGITWDHPRGLAPLRATAALFGREHEDIRITWVARSLQSFGEEPIERLARDYDLLVIDHPFVGVAASSGCLVPLEAYISAEFLAAQAAQSVGPSYESYSYDGHQWALAIDAAAQVSAYRPDPLGWGDVAVPRTWSDVLELASRPGVAVPLGPAGAIDSFLTLCANHGEPPGRDPLRLVGRTTAYEALDILRHLVAHVHPMSLTCDPPQALDHMSTTDEIIYCPLLFGYSNYARSGYAPHLCRFANIPRVSDGEGPLGAILGGAGLAVSARCRSVPEACAYAQSVAGPDWQRTIYAASGGQPGNRLAWTDLAVNGATNNFFLDTLDTLDHAYLRPRYDGFVYCHDEAGLILHDYLRHGRKRDAVLDRLDTIYRDSRSKAGQ